MHNMWVRDIGKEHMKKPRTQVRLKQSPQPCANVIQGDDGHSYDTEQCFLGDMGLISMATVTHVVMQRHVV